MSVVRKVRAVERLFGVLDREIAGFRAASGLSCRSGCGECCLKPDIDASPLEFLPYALHAFHAGTVQEEWERLRTGEESVCVLLSRLRASGTGWCSVYPHRGLICRLFGFGSVRNKEGKPVLSTCRIIKTDLAEKYEAASESVNSGSIAAPSFGYYYQKLAEIDPVLGSTTYPINQAIKIAMETVMQYYTYRKPRKTA